jgi:hypothetical protein
MHISVKYSSRLDLPTLKGNEGHRKTTCLIGPECKISNDFRKHSQSSGTMSKGQVQNRPENKDNLDSRHREEEMVKGNHITNNQKEDHSLGKQKR